jgi:hypothetical protein
MGERFANHRLVLVTGTRTCVAVDAARAEALAQDLNKRYLLDTQMQSLWLPAIHAQLALNRKSPSAAVPSLQPALPPIEYGLVQFVSNLSCLYPTYIRGEAYPVAGQGKETVAKFSENPRPQRHRLELLDGSLGASGRGACLCAAIENLTGG